MGWCRVAIVLAVLAFAPPEATRSVLACAASALFEALPFVMAAAALGRMLPAGAIAFAGCGCAPGPSARSLPAAAAIVASFGPGVALARVAAACVVARLASDRNGHCCANEDGWLPDLRALVPAAIAAGALQSLTSLEPARIAPWLQFAGGAVAGALGAPCGFGTAALAASLHGRAPAAAAGLLCTAGIVDVRSFARRAAEAGHDAAGYAGVAAAALALGLHRGAGFVHPALGAALLPCAAVAGVAAARCRTHASRGARLAPAIMLAGAFAGSPAPQYRATETTMTGLFPGERLTFTGVLAHRDTVVRYAITCCRADAMPVAVRLTRDSPLRHPTWVRVDGTVVRRGQSLELESSSVERIDPPPDPFVYR